MRPAPLLALSLLLAACGARTSLQAGGASSAGSGGSTSSASTGTAGSGGAGDPCAVMTLAGEPIGALADEQHHQIHPALVLTAEGFAVALFGMAPVEGPIAVPTHIGDTSPLPLKQWPKDLGPMALASERGGDAFVAATSDEAGMALLLNPKNQGSFGDLAIIPSVQPGDPAPPTIIQQNDTLATPIFLTRTKGRYLGGTSLSQSNGITQLALDVIEQGPAVKESFILSGCAHGAVSASGVPQGDGFLAAFSSARLLDHCDDDGPLGPATRVQMVRWSPGTPQQLDQGLDIDIGDTIGQVALVPRSDGAWLVFQGIGANAEQPGPIEAARVDASGMLLSPPAAITPDGISGPWAAAALGDRLAVAWPNSIEPGAPALAMTVLDAEGGMLPGTGAGVLMNLLASDRIAALGSPAGDALFVAWSIDTAQNAVPQRLQVVRFDCVGP